MSEQTTAAQRVIASVVVLCGCQVAAPVSAVNGCLAPTVEHVRQTGESESVLCTFDRPTTLLALPATMPSKAQLRSQGLDDDAVESLLRMQTAGSKWCTVVKTSQAAADGKPTWEVQCVGANVQIDRTTVVNGRTITATLVVTHDRQVRVTELKAGS